MSAIARSGRAIDAQPIDAQPIDAHALEGSATLGASMTLRELAALGQAEAPASIEASAELLRLGLELPNAPERTTAQQGTRHPAPPLEALRDVARIGAHLGRLERAVSTLGPDEGAELAARLARVQVLVDCAHALAELRTTVLGALRTARSV